MEAKSLVLFLYIAVFVGGVLGQVATMCRPKGRFLMCGCPKTCRDPVPECKGVCRTGCFCEDDEVRNGTGHCVKLADCPPMSAAYKRDTSEPRANGGICPENEEYRFCEPCNRSCDNPNPICPAQCARGCFCKGNLLRDKDGRCVRLEKCSNFAHLSESVNRIKRSDQMTCGDHQVLGERCERTCSDPNPVCPSTYNRGCFCEDGYVRAPSGQCVKLENCPKAEMTVGQAHEPSIEDCASDEEYLSCGWCEPSCSEPRPACPADACTRGCLCRPPRLRHRSGHCVHQRDCLPHKCSSPNEEYVCRYGCEPRCDARVCAVRPQRCELGCHCKFGLLRDVLTGLCVTENRCTNAKGTLV